MIRLLLASNSPRRKELLALGKQPFDALASNADESRLPGESPRDYVLRLAEAKARAVSARTEQIVVGADTAVIDGDEILGKPQDAADAARMLKQLRGRTHQVYTAVAVLCGGEARLELCETDVPMRAYSDEEIAAYVAGGDPLDKAGAYAIQHAGFSPVAEMRGCYAGVMGLPLCHLARALQQTGVPFHPRIAESCQDYLHYSCPVWKTILKER